MLWLLDSVFLRTLEIWPIVVVIFIFTLSLNDTFEKLIYMEYKENPLPYKRESEADIPKDDICDPSTMDYFQHLTILIFNDKTEDSEYEEKLYELANLHDSNETTCLDIAKLEQIFTIIFNHHHRPTRQPFLTIILSLIIKTISSEPPEQSDILKAQFFSLLQLAIDEWTETIKSEIHTKTIEISSSYIEFISFMMTPRLFNLWGENLSMKFG